MVVLSPSSFRVDLYRVETSDDWKRDEAGFLVPEGDPHRSHTFSDGGKPGSGQFEAVESSGASRKHHLYEWDGAENRWSLRSGGEEALAERIAEDYDDATATLVKTWSSVDPKNDSTKETVRIFLLLTELISYAFTKLMSYRLGRFFQAVMGNGVMRHFLTLTRQQLVNACFAPFASRQSHRRRGQGTNSE